MGEREQPVEVRVAALLEQIKANAARVKELGKWPSYVEEESLAERVPKQGDDNAPGFDAGLACALDLIAKDKQELAATLHAAYTPDAVEKVRTEMENLDPDSETCWWLAACTICTEGKVNQQQFLKQIEEFKKLASDPEARKTAALKEYEDMTSKFNFDDTIGENIPFGTADGCMQGAYIKGYPFAVQYAENYGIYFIGTYQESLGLEGFKWSEEKDEKGRAKSGPVWGSKQFVKCSTKEELLKALEMVKTKFKDEVSNKEN